MIHNKCFIFDFLLHEAAPGLTMLWLIISLRYNQPRAWTMCTTAFLHLSNLNNACLKCFRLQLQRDSFVMSRWQMKPWVTDSSVILSLWIGQVVFSNLGNYRWAEHDKKCWGHTYGKPKFIWGMNTWEFHSLQKNALGISERQRNA